QFLERMHKPDCDSISGIPPAIAIQQNVQSRNPRSTVGTTTEIYDYLRLLYDRIGKTICYGCCREVVKDTLQMIVESVMNFEEGSKIYIAFPFPESARDIKNYIELYKEAGYFRLINLEDNTIVESDRPEVKKDLDALNSA